MIFYAKDSAMTDVKDLDSATLARIDERTQAQTVSLANHATALATHVKEDADNRTEDRKESAEKLDKVITFVSKRFDKMDERFDKIEESNKTQNKEILDKIGTLWDDNNQRKGAFSASKLLTGGVWAAIVVAITYFIPGRGQ